MLTPGWQELVVIMIIVLFVFGAKRLPEMGQSLGRGIREFKKSLTTDLDDEMDSKEEDKKPEIKEDITKEENNETQK
jgi:sec-independent protein translocase protein TatA